MTDRTEATGYVQATRQARPALQAWLREHGTLAAAAAAHPGAETLRGRGRVHVVPAPTRPGGAGAAPESGGRADARPESAASDASPGDAPERWVVRHYHRGGAIAPILGDRYLRLGTPRPLRELRVGWELEARGIPTPAHLGAAVYPSGIWYRGDLVTRWVPGSRDLAAVLFPGRTLAAAAADEAADGVEGDAADSALEGTPPGPRRIDSEPAMHATGRLFRQLHEAGVAHPDLNLKNILLRARWGDRVEALVLDLDGAELRSGLSGRARGRMIARFWRSARKWQKATGIGLPASLEAAFEAGYGTGSPDSAGA